jgi:hypothetical protein
MSSEALYNSWHSIVNENATLQLIYDSDVLPAISGLAQLFQQYVDARYIAGMWQSFLATDLTWHSNDGGLWVRQTSWVAPTFSWTCNKLASGPLVDPRTLVYSMHWTNDSTNSEFEMLDLSQTLTGPDPTGRITQAQLVLKGVLYSVF